MADEVFEYTGPNPPGLDVISQHGTVLWKHPQHGWLKADRNGSFTPVAEAAALKMLSPVPAPTPTPGPTVGGVGAGTTTAVALPTMTPGQRREERIRAKKEGEVQGELTKAQFRPEERADPMAGLGIVERAQVDKLVKAGMAVEEAVKKVRPQAASSQAEALKP